MIRSAQIVASSGLFTAGGAQADTRRTEYHFDGTDFATYASGKHQLSFGIDIPDISRRGLDDFHQPRRDLYLRQLPTMPPPAMAATYLVQTGQGHVAFLERVICGFVEDNIRLRPNFSLYLGVRYYWQNYFHDEPHNFAPRVELRLRTQRRKARRSSAEARACSTIAPGQAPSATCCTSMA